MSESHDEYMRRLIDRARIEREVRVTRYTKNLVTPATQKASDEGGDAMLDDHCIEHHEWDALRDAVEQGLLGRSVPSGSPDNVYRCWYMCQYKVKQMSGLEW